MTNLGIDAYPTGLAFDDSGNLYVASASSMKIYKYDPSGGTTSVFFANSEGYVYYPLGLAFDSNGFLYVASSWTIVKLDSTGQPITIFPASPDGLAFDRSGNLYATSRSGDTIYKFDASGNATLFASAGLSGPKGLAFDHSGNLYVANFWNGTIQKFDPDGHGTVFAYTRGYPNGIAFDTAGNLYVAEGNGNGMIEKFNLAGQGSVFAGAGDPYFIAIQPSAIPTHTYISGNISYCSNPVPGPVPNVTLTLTGDATTSTLTFGSGDYQFSSLPSGGTYTVTPSKAALTPGSAGINTTDVIAVQRHFTSCDAHPDQCLSGCRLTAADVNGNGIVDTIDVVAIQRFFLGLSTGIANVGKYQFTPVNRTYTGLTSDQTAQNYDTIVFGDVASPFTE